MAVDQETLIKLQKVEAEILDEFVRICDENKLSYFLHAGTLLGAVRHKGFIPWDDDVDVGMPRNDYEKFIDIYNKLNETNYYVLSYKSKGKIAQYYQYFAKLCKNRTVFAEDYRDPVSYPGIYIDIWPFDNCVLFFAPLQTKLIKIIFKLYRLKAHIIVPQKKYKIFISKLLCCFFSLKFMDYFHQRLYLIFNRFNTKYISFFCGIYGYKKETHKYTDVFPLSKVYFEGKYYNAPGNWDLFLREMYGNYMELPPLEKQINHEPKYIIFGEN